MIDIKEIRIGNIVNYTINNVGGGISIGRGLITALTENKTIINGKPIKYCNLLSLPLEEEILLSLGFKIEVDDITKDKRYRLRLKGFCIDINRYSNTLGRDYSVHIDNLCCDSILGGDIQYLHQLQNYIYDATGEGLDLKELFK